MPSNSEEVVILTNTINTCKQAIEESELGVMIAYKDGISINRTPENMVVNNVALQGFYLLLGEKVKSMYELNNKRILDKS